MKPMPRAASTAARPKWPRNSHALKGTAGTVPYAPDIDNARNKAFVNAWKARFNRLPTDNEGLAYNGMLVIFDGVKKAGSVKPAEVSKALRSTQIDSLYGQVIMRAADNQLRLPNYVGSVKQMNGVLHPVPEREFAASINRRPLRCARCRLRQIAEYPRSIDDFSRSPRRHRPWHLPCAGTPGAGRPARAAAANQPGDKLERLLAG